MIFLTLYVSTATINSNTNKTTVLYISEKTLNNFGKKMKVNIIVSPNILKDNKMTSPIIPRMFRFLFEKEPINPITAKAIADMANASPKVTKSIPTTRNTDTSTPVNEE